MLQAERSSFLTTELAHVLNTTPESLDLSLDFGESGGDSIAALNLSRRCRSVGISLTAQSILSCVALKELFKIVDTEQSRYKHVTIASADLIETGNDSPQSSIPSRNHTKILALSNQSVAEESRGDIYPVTACQSHLLRALDSKERPCYVSTTHKYQRADFLKVQRAWKICIDREPIFCVAFEEEDGLTHMRLGGVKSIIWEDIIASNRHEYLKQVRKAQASNPVDLPMKIVCIHQDFGYDPEFCLIWTVQHALMDSYSLTLFRQKLTEVLQGRYTQPRLSFLDFSKKLYQYQKHHAREAAKFWRKELPILGAETSANGYLRLAKPTNLLNAQDFAHGNVAFDFPASLLEPAAKAWRIPRSTLYVAAWARACSVATASDTVCFGIALSGRNIPIAGVEDVVGPVFNTLPLTLGIESFPTLRDFAKHVAARIKRLSEFSWTSPPQRDGMAFDSCVTFWHDAEYDPRISRDAHAIRYDSEIPVSVIITQEHVRIQYREDIFLRCGVQSLADIFRHFLQASCQFSQWSSSPLVKELPPMMKSKMCEQSGCNASASRVPSRHQKGDSLVSLFRSVANAIGAQVALQRGSATMSYEVLDQHSDFVACQLLLLIKPGEAVGVLADWTFEWIVAVWAVLKAGGVYYPIHPTLPPKIIDEQFEIARARIFLGSSSSRQTHQKPRTAAASLYVDQLRMATEGLAPSIRSRLLAALTFPIPSSTAYLCFTSGSSGRPKGVNCTHEALVAFQSDFDVRLKSRPGWKVAQVMSPSFDGSIHEIFSALTYGATLVIGSNFGSFDQLAFADAAVLTPTVARSLDPTDFKNLKVLYLVGEPVTVDVTEKWGPSVQLYNAYGPTESTCAVTMKELIKGQKITVGKRCPSSRIYVLDTRRRLLPPGFVGEVFTAGIQVAKGYISLSDENDSKFMSDSISPGPLERMYRTGDEAFWDDNGEVILLGRLDQQHKIDGFRIDLDDLEVRISRVLKEASAVHCFVDEGVLIAAVAPRVYVTGIVKDKLRLHLPMHMIPQRILMVDKMPLTTAGKIGYRKLKKMLSDDDMDQRPLHHAFADEELRLAQLWRSSLDLNPNTQLRPHSSIRGLGVDSMGLYRLRANISKTFGVKIPLSAVMEATTLADMAKIVASTMTSTSQTRQRRTLSGTELHPSCLTPMENEWWARQSRTKQLSTLNVTFACTLPDDLDRRRYAAAWNDVLRRHVVVSSRFVYNKSKGCAERQFHENPTFVSHCEKINLYKETQKSFNLAKDCLFRVLISPKEVLIVASHIICDFTALRHLMSEVKMLYFGESLPPAKSYWRAPSIANGAVVEERHRNYWRRTLSHRNCRNVLTSSKIDLLDGASSVFEIDKSLLRAIRRLSTIYEITLHQFFLAVTAISLNHHDDPRLDMTLGSPDLNRDMSTEADVAGLFLQPIPIRVIWPPRAETSLGRGSRQEQSPPPDTLHAFFSSVREASEQARCHALPWQMLRRLLEEQGILSRTEGLVDTMVTFHDNNLWKSSLFEGMRPRLTWCEGAKFNCLVEWTAAAGDERLFLRLEYNKDWAGEEDIADLAARMVQIMQHLVKGEDCISPVNLSDSSEELVTSGILRQNGVDGVDLFGAYLQ